MSRFPFQEMLASTPGGAGGVSLLPIPADGTAGHRRTMALAGMRAEFDDMAARVRSFHDVPMISRAGESVMMLGRIVGGMHRKCDYPFQIHIVDGETVAVCPGWFLARQGENHYGPIEPKLEDGTALSKVESLPVTADAVKVWLEVKLGEMVNVKSCPPVGGGESCQWGDNALDGESPITVKTGEEWPEDDAQTVNVRWFALGSGGADRSVTIYLRDTFPIDLFGCADLGGGVAEPSPLPPPWVNGFEDDPPLHGELGCPADQHPAWNAIHGLWECTYTIDWGGGSESGSGPGGSGSQNGSGSGSPSGSPPSGSPPSPSGSYPSDSSSPSSSSSKSYSDSPPSYSYPSSKSDSHAIVRVVLPEGERFIQWSVVEAPEPAFEIDLTVRVSGMALIELPAVLRHGVVPSSLIVLRAGIVGGSLKVPARIIGHCVYLEAPIRPTAIPVRVRVRGRARQVEGERWQRQPADIAAANGRFHRLPFLVSQ